MRTAEIARAAGVHPNTIRLYEKWGFIPAPERGPNGYRLFSDRHLEQALLVRQLLQSSWLGGSIRGRALAAITRSAAGDWAGALSSAKEALARIRDERRRAEHAVELLRTWAAEPPTAADSFPGLSRHQAAARLAVRAETLRNWERNGLLTVPRQAGNSYRVYGAVELRRLAVIRALRQARYSMMAIYRMFHQLDADRQADPASALDTVATGEEDAVYCTDRWLTRVSEIEDAAQAAVRRLTAMRKRFS